MSGWTAATTQRQKKRGEKMKDKTVGQANSLIERLVNEDEIEELKRQLMKRWAKDFYSQYIEEARIKYKPSNPPQHKRCKICDSRIDFGKSFMFHNIQPLCEECYKQLRGDKT